MAKVVRAAVIVFLTVSGVFGGALSCIWLTETDSPDHDSVFTTDHLLTANAQDLKSTAVTAHLEEPVQPGRNVLWCGTFQLTWNEACSLIGEDLHFEKDVPAVALMNKKLFTRDDLDDRCYVALAGFVRDKIAEKIPKALQDKFGAAAKPRLIDRAVEMAPRPQDFIAYSYLFKNLEFPKPFERLDLPLRFGAVPVKCFGVGDTYKPGHASMCDQVTILDYASKDDFVIELKTKSGADHVILARIEPGADLLKTVRSVEERAAKSTGEPMRLGDILKIPKLNFDITREYSEFYNSKLAVRNPKVDKDIELLLAIQNIRFQVDEKGVRLRSESVMVFSCAAQRQVSPTHIMVFDKPFLILLKQTAAGAPYFALWVDNAELLVKD